MEKFNYNGCEIEIYSGYNGDEVFVTRDGDKVYSCRTNKGEGRQRGMEKAR